MKEFNYKDYLKYQFLKKIERKGILQIEDIGEIYRLDKPHDKLFKIILSEKKQVVELLNRILKLETNLIENDIERYNSEHINYMFKGSESDIVYKMNNKEIFFLIEHQRKIDYSMPKRILEYEVEIIREAVRGKKMTKRAHKLPKVIPIVIYTGTGKWNVEKYIEECQEILGEADRIKLGEYYVIDANDYTNEELKNDNLFLYKMLLLEKLKKEEEIFNMLSYVTEIEQDEENREILKRIIVFILKEKLNSENIKLLLEKLEREGNEMVVEVIHKENERQRKLGMKAGIKAGIKEILEKSVKNMIESGEDEEKIMKYLEINRQELEKIKEKLVKS